MYRHYYKGELVASSEKDRAKKLTVWEVFEEYADIRDDMEDLLMDFQGMMDEIETVMSDLADGLGELEERLDQCDRTFRRFKSGYKEEKEPGRIGTFEEMEHPFREGAPAL